MHKQKSQSYGSYILDNKEQLLKRKKRIIRAKRTGIILVILIAVLITLCLTLPIFNIREIEISGNSIVSSDEIRNIMGIADGQNIFKFRKTVTVKQLMSNPYIHNVKIDVKLPNKLYVNIDERNTVFYIGREDGYDVIDEDGVYLEKRDNIDNISLIKLIGAEGDGEPLEIGKPILDDSEKLKSLTTIYKFLKVNNLLEKYNVSSIEINDFLEMKLNINEFSIKLGTADDMFNKLSKAFNIIESSNLEGLKGYIDVSYNGNPVIYKNPEE